MLYVLYTWLSQKNDWRTIMALPIKPTPKLNEEESEKFLEELYSNEDKDVSLNLKSLQANTINVEKRILSYESG